MKVHQVVARELVACGTEVVFGVIGEGNLEIVDNLVANRGVPYLATAREDGAVLAADGYARVSGRVGVCSTTRGPALTNAVTALAEAARARTPLVMVAGDTAPGRGLLQDIDQADVVRSTGAGLQQLGSAASAAEDVVLAFRRADSERRPIVLNIPEQLVAEDCPGGSPERSELARSGVRPAAAAVRRAVDLLERAERPVLLAGRGAWRSGAAARLVELGEQVGALLATSALAKDMFRGHPFNIGICGSYASPATRRLILQSDCVVAFGASLNRYTTEHGGLMDHATLIHCDSDAGRIGEWQRADQALHGDAAAAAADLLAECRRRGLTRAGWRSDELARELASQRYEFDDQSDASGMDLRAAITTLDRLLPAERTVVVDGGAFHAEPIMNLGVPDPDGFIFGIHFGSIGLGLGLGIGAAVARPDRASVVVVGDGGLMMSLAELDTITRYQLPVVVAVMNDAAYGAELFALKAHKRSPGLAYFDRPELAGLMDAFGGSGATVCTVDDLLALEPELAKPSGPMLLDIKLRRGVVTDWYRRLMPGA
jgi:thiamine pyrophosphate-dependent acetolactate synthase large subunit-like protein